MREVTRESRCGREGVEHEARFLTVCKVSDGFWECGLRFCSKVSGLGGERGKLLGSRPLM